MELQAQVTPGTPQLQLNRRTPLFHAVAYVIGFSVIFTALGAAIGLLGGSGQGGWRDYLEIGAGAILIVFGIHLTGAFHIPVISNFLYRERGPHASGGSRPNYLRSFIVGSSFAIGWTPCVGPILASILVLSFDSSTIVQGALLLFVYSLGLGLPFLFVGAFLGFATKQLKKVNRYLDIISLASGILLILIGVLIATDSLQQLNQYFSFLPSEAAGSASIVNLDIASLLIAFGGGLLSFVSPCVLPLVPVYIGYLTGVTFEDAERGAARIEAEAQS